MTSFVTSQGSTTANNAPLACETCCHHGLPRDMLVVGVVVFVTQDE